MTIDMTQYAIGTDLWEGDDDPDYPTMACGGCQFAIIRMNQSDGSLTLDRQFHNWTAAYTSGLKLGAYVVISPFISRQAYVAWIKANIPADCKVIALDVEIQGTTSRDYSVLVSGILADLKTAGFQVLLYSGTWFYGYLNPWPSSYQQWWARYPYSVQPSPYQRITWEQLRIKLAALPSYDPLDGYNINPGEVVCWQCSSAFILPGGPLNWPIDINVMPLAAFERLWGKPELTDHEKTSLMWAEFIKTHPQ